MREIHRRTIVKGFGVGLFGLATGTTGYLYRASREEDRNISNRDRISTTVDLSKPVIEEAEQIIKHFEKYQYMPQVVILDYEKSGIKMGLLSQVVYLSSPLFTHPDPPNEGFLALHHELSHVLFAAVRNNIVDQRLNGRMFDTYKALVDSVSKSGQCGELAVPFAFSVRDCVGNSPQFSNLDEDTYMKRLNVSKGGGHPHDNYDELFASSLTVFRYFPDQFLERFFESDPETKKAASKVLNNVVDILGSYDKLGRGSAVSWFIPQIDLLRPVLDYQYK